MSKCPRQVARFLWFERHLLTFRIVGVLLGVALALVGSQRGWLTSNQFWPSMLLFPYLGYRWTVEVMTGVTNGWSRWMAVATLLVGTWLYTGAVREDDITVSEGLASSFGLGPLLGTLVAAWVSKLRSWWVGFRNDIGPSLLLAAPHSMQTGQTRPHLLSAEEPGACRATLWETTGIGSTEDARQYLSETGDHLRADAPGSIAYQCARTVEIVRYAYTAGLLNSRESVQYLKALHAQVMKEYSSWAEFGEALKLGEAEWCEAHELEPVLAKDIDELLTDTDSQWRQAEWRG